MRVWNELFKFGIYKSEKGAYFEKKKKEMTATIILPLHLYGSLINDPLNLNKNKKKQQRRI